MLAEHQLSAGSNARNDDMASARQKDKIEKIMHEHKESTLKSDSGKKVKTRHLIEELHSRLPDIQGHRDGLK